MSEALKPRRKSVHIFTKLLAEARALYEQSIGIRDDIISKILVQSMQRKMEQHVADVLHSWWINSRFGDHIMMTAGSISDTQCIIK